MPPKNETPAAPAAEAESQILTDEQLQALSDEDLEARGNELQERYAEVSESPLTRESLAERQELVAQIESARTEGTRRQEEQADLEAQAAELDARLNPEAEGDDGEGEGDGEGEDKGDDGEGEGKPTTTVETETTVTTDPEAEVAEPIAASTRPRASEVARRRPADRAPIHTRPRTPIVASGDLRGITAGTEFRDADQMLEALYRRWETIRNGRGNDEKVMVASIQGRFPEDRMLGNDAARNAELIEAVVGEEALVAAGGLCAPAEPYYGLAQPRTAARPVRDSLARFGADRGGIVFVPPPRDLSAFDGATGVVTVAQDSSGVEKSCAAFDCEPSETVQVAGLYKCTEFNNFNERFYPERISTFNDVAQVNWARMAETFLLDAIAAASTAVTAGPEYGAARTILRVIPQAAAGYRSRHRLSLDTKLRVLAPGWLPDLMRVDMAGHQNNDMLGIADERLEAILAASGINVTWYLDSETGEGQVFGAEAGGALNSFPGTANIYLFHEGAFLHLDGGALDLGLVRDSTLNTRNSMQFFYESFENVAFVGLESIELEVEICPDGTAAELATPITCA